MQTPKVKLSLIGMSVFVALGLVACAGNKTMAQKKSPKIADNAISSTALEVNTTTSLANQTQQALVISQPDEPVIIADESAVQDKLGPTAYSKPEQSVIFFPFNQSSLTDAEITLLKKHAEYLVANPDLHIDINGHTDSHGPKVYNNYLSRKRAETVAAILLDNGVDAEQIHTQGFADEQPYHMASSTRQQRRVELIYPAAGALATLQ